MKFAFLFVAALALAGCDEIEWAKQEPPRVVNGIEVESGIDIERLIREEPGLTEACKAKLRRRGLAALPNETDQCFQMRKPQRWRGLWRAEFEGSQFCPEPATICDPMTKEPKIWLDGFEDVAREMNGKLYRVEFVGRRTLHAGPFGHMGGSEHEIIVDRPISIEEVKEE